MRTWARAALGGLAVVALAFAVLAGTGAYFVFRGMEKRVSGEADAVKEIEVVKARFGQRAPLVEIVDPVRADIRINRPPDASAAKVDTVHVMSWKREDGELMRTAVPLWLLRFSSVNVLSQLGLAPEKFRLTVGDIERYGPGIIVDYGSPGASRLLMWVD